jgi:GT2 family glycosyltransferase
LGALQPEQVEIIVVDNASADDSAEMVRTKYSQVLVIENRENAGFARANNQAIAAGSGTYILLLNSDTEVHEGALQALVAFMDAHPRAGAAGARLLNSDGSPQAACHPMLTPWREAWRLMFLDNLWPKASYRIDDWDIETPRQVEVIKGACLLLRRAALDEVGLLDERYHMYTEEVDLCYRLNEAGWELWYVPRAIVTHHGGASSALAAEEMYLQLYRSKLQFYRKMGGERRARWFKTLTLLAYLPRAIAQPQRRVYRRLLAELPGM